MAIQGIEPRTSDLRVRCHTTALRGPTRVQAKDTEQIMGNQRRQNTLHSKTHHEHQKGYTNQGPAIQIAVPKGKSVNAKFYKGNILHKLKKYFLSRRPATGLRGVRLLHDKAAIVRDYLKQGKGCRASAPSLFARSCPIVTRNSKNTSLEENIKRAKSSVRLFFSV